MLIADEFKVINKEAFTILQNVCIESVYRFKGNEWVCHWDKSIIAIRIDEGGFLHAAIAESEMELKEHTLVIGSFNINGFPLKESISFNQIRKRFGWEIPKEQIWDI